MKKVLNRITNKLIEKISEKKIERTIQRMEAHTKFEQGSSRRSRNTISLDTYARVLNMYSDYINNQDFTVSPKAGILNR